MLKNRNRHILKYVTCLLLSIVIILSLCSCSLTDSILKGPQSGEDNKSVSYTPYEKVADKNAILDKLLDSMHHNQTTCTFYVNSMDLISADDWINELTGIETLNCEYRQLAGGYNVLVTLKFWDNYPIYYAYKNNDTQYLSSKQLELYNRYIAVYNECVSQSATLYANELAIHDYLVNNIEYVDDQSDDIYNAYDALINGKAVCSGYTEVFKTFMDMIGINCITISGNAGDEKHIWNMVELNNEWYHVDVTWDDPVNNTGLTHHMYFNITDADISTDHSFDSRQYPQADATAFSYYYYNNVPIYTNQAQLNMYIAQQMDMHFTSIEVITEFNPDVNAAIAYSNKTVTYSYHQCVRNKRQITNIYIEYK